MRNYRIIAEIPAAAELAAGTAPLPAAAHIPPSELNHLKNVLRLSTGSRVVVIDRSSGIEFFGEIVELESSSGSLRLIGAADTAAGGPRITAVIGYPKHAVADSAVEKLTELGIDRIVFFAAARTQGKIGERAARWERLADTAVKQSGGRAMPKLQVHCGLSAALRSFEAESGLADTANLRLVCLAPVDRREGADLGQDMPEKHQLLPILSLFEVNGPLCLQKSRRIDEIYLLVGPEGGLSRDEIELLLGAGYAPVSLGRRTLRAETALILAFGILAAWRSEQLPSS